MLRNILDYDCREFVFSFNSQRDTGSTLHHNSMVSNNLQSYRINLENEKIHFRITKAKSLYSQ
jgi:hypothetical protein